MLNHRRGREADLCAWENQSRRKVKTMNAYENSYDLDYEDGDSETRVPARLIRPLATAAPRDLIPTPLTTTSQAPPPADLEPGAEL